MKKLLLLITGLCIAITLFAQQDEVLTNISVIDMFTKKLPTSIIMGKIKSSKNTFNVETEALLLLTGNKIPEEIINAMIEAANDGTRKLIVFDPNNPKDIHAPGIYYFNKVGEKVEMLRLDPSIYSQNKSKGALAMSLTYGLAKVKTMVTIDGKSSRLELNNSKPEFYIYFDVSNNKPTGTGEWWFSTASSPNEFLLVKLEQNKKTREVVTGSANIMGSSVGIDDKNKAVFKTEKIADGIFRIYFDDPLQGEYCFMYAGTIPTGFTTLDKVYDFGISKK